MPRPQWQRAAFLAAGIAVLGGLIAVTVVSAGGSDPPGPRATSSAVPVIVPGRPGESASVVPGTELKAPDGTAYNAADAWFVHAMISHHAQGVEMAALASGRAGRAQLRAIADRIRIAQDGEIAQLRSWLQSRGLSDQPAGHDHGAMRGMQSPAALAALSAATGDAFDRMFVDMMSEHHQGAIDMANELLSAGRDVEVERLATGIAAEQSAEIARLRDALAG